ncbi:hypothetical protein KAR91_66390 [Candidatus Pacearchaeota archaeon]|nr:hypothetical protein [Candidatus Pacearchaeota archaeon]
MTNILCWGIFTLVLLLLGIPIGELELDGSSNRGWSVITIIAGIVSLIWCVVIINIISAARHTQLSRILQLDQERERKLSYRSQLDEYTTSLKSILVDDYRDFEKTLMDSVKDSNLLAAYMKDSSYSKILSEYSNTVKNIQESVYSCDRVIYNLTRKINLEKNDTWNNGLFIPGLPPSTVVVRSPETSSK